jgi:hypothetical protein
LGIASLQHTTNPSARNDGNKKIEKILSNDPIISYSDILPNSGFLI